MAGEGKMNRRDLQARLVAKAWKDERFAADLSRDPRATIEAELKSLGLKTRVPDTVEIRVLQETPTNLYIVIPPKPVRGTLSDEQLEQMAGGARGDPPPPGQDIWDWAWKDSQMGCGQ